MKSFNNIFKLNKKIMHPYIIFICGIIAGIVIFLNIAHFEGRSTSISDTLLVNELYGSPQDLNTINNDIYQNRHNSITRAVEKISPAVVSVNVVQVKEYVRRSPFFSRDPFLRELFPELFKDQHYQQQIKSLGSGFIISSDGFILTNDHVIEDATKIIITMLGGTEANAEIIGTDPTSDVALLKINKNNLPHVTLGNSDEVILGEWAIAIGNPFGLFEINNKPTVTVGVISALDRDFGEIERRIYQDMIQTDASINHGNSGGPLCNALGEVIGMNTFIYTGSRYSEGSVGIGFAIPINRITRLLDDLKKYKKVDRDFWVGIKVQNLSSIIARKMGYNSTNGIIVTNIDKGSPAEIAGFKLGDIITRIEDHEIINDKDIFNVIFETDLKVGDKLKFQVWREGVQLELVLLLTSIKG
jgi:serine protease Do